jgi:hypothetical protein
MSSLGRCTLAAVELDGMEPTGAVVPGVSTRPAASAQFTQDVVRALGVWRATPALPLLTVTFAVCAAWSSSRWTGHILAALVTVAFLGWAGSERLWYLRAFTGRTLSVRAALSVSFSYWPRLLCLSLLVGVVTVPLSIPITIAAMRGSTTGGTRHVNLGVGWLVYSAALSLLIDFTLTFVTPALIYTSGRARDALTIGLGLLRQTWPHAAPYVLIPPLAVVILGRLSQGPVGVVGAAVIVVSYALNLLAKGATASYYLRLVAPIGPDGDLERYVPGV